MKQSLNFFYETINGDGLDVEAIFPFTGKREDGLYDFENGNYTYNLDFDEKISMFKGIALKYRDNDKDLTVEKTNSFLETNSKIKEFIFKTKFGNFGVKKEKGNDLLTKQPIDELSYWFATQLKKDYNFLGFWFTPSIVFYANTEKHNNVFGVNLNVRRYFKLSENISFSLGNTAGYYKNYRAKYSTQNDYVLKDTLYGEAQISKLYGSYGYDFYKVKLKNLDIKVDNFKGTNFNIGLRDELLEKR